MRLAIQRLHPDARLPTLAYRYDAGFDLYSVERVELGPGERASVATGLAIELPERYAGLVLPRSGLAVRHGLTVVNAPGLIDAGYRGEVKVLLLNTDRAETCALEAGERIAQLIVVKAETPDVVEVDELAPSERGERGFGSSG